MLLLTVKGKTQTERKKVVLILMDQLPSELQEHILHFVVPRACFCEVAAPPDAVNNNAAAQQQQLAKQRVAWARMKLLEVSRLMGVCRLWARLLSDWPQWLDLWRDPPTVERSSHYATLRERWMVSKGADDLACHWHQSVIR